MTLLPDLVRAERDPSVAVRALAEGTITRELFLLSREAGRARPALAAVREALAGEARRAGGPAPGRAGSG